MRAPTTLSWSFRRWLLLLCLPVLLCIQLYLDATLADRMYFPFEPLPPGHSQRPLPSTARQADIRNRTEALIARYMSFHKRNRHNPHARKLIYTGKGNMRGFGDRFRGIVYSFHLALLTQRVLLIDWQEPFPLSLIFESAADASVMYDARIDPGPLPVMATWNGDRRSALRIDPQSLPACDCTFEKPGILLSDDRDVVVRTEHNANVWALRKALQKLTTRLPAARALSPLAREWDRIPGSLILRALLRPAPPLIGRLARAGGRLRDIVPPRLRAHRRGESRGYISVHARLGAGVGEGRHDRFNLSKQGASLALVAECLSRTAAQEADDADLPEPQTFYLATDTPAFVGLFRKEIGRWSREAKVEGIGAKVVHTAHMRDASERNKVMFIDTAAELFFLSAGERLVSVPSGFANLAAFLGELPHTQKRIEDCVRDKRL